MPQGMLETGVIFCWEGQPQGHLCMNGSLCLGHSFPSGRTMYESVILEMQVWMNCAVIGMHWNPKRFLWKCSFENSRKIQLESLNQYLFIFSTVSLTNVHQKQQRDGS
jgi:hypothetical protein